MPAARRATSSCCDRGASGSDSTWVSVDDDASMRLLRTRAGLVCGVPWLAASLAA